MELTALALCFFSSMLIIRRGRVLAPEGFLLGLALVYIAIPGVIYRYAPFVRVQSLELGYDPALSPVVLYYSAIFSLGSVLLAWRPIPRMPRISDLEILALRILLALGVISSLYLFVSVSTTSVLLGATRDAAFQVYEQSVSPVQNFLIFLMFGAVPVLYAATRSWKVLLVLLAPVAVDIAIAGRSFIGPAFIALCMARYLSGRPLGFSLAFAFIVFVFTFGLLRSEDLASIFEPSEGVFEIFGESVNVFAGAVLAERLELSTPWSELLSAGGRYLLPPGTSSIGSLVGGTFSSRDSIGIALNEEFRYFLEIYGLAVSSIAEGIITPWLWLVLPFAVLIFVVVTMHLTQRIGAAGGILLCILLAKSLSLFRWGAIETLMTVLQYGIYFALPWWVLLCKQQSASTGKAQHAHA